jgi:hypothetical protein
VFPGSDIKSGGESKPEQYPVVFVTDESTPQRSVRAEPGVPLRFFLV